MKTRFITAIILISIIFTVFSVPVYGAMSYDERLAQNKALVANERTDEFALDGYKNKWMVNSDAYAEIRQLAQTITAGITDDYAKVKAIHDWVATNIWYDYDNSVNRGAVSVLKYRIGMCGGYADLTVALAQAAGFPAKVIGGHAVGVGAPRGHDWSEVYVNGKWRFMDTMADSWNAYVDGEFSEQMPCDHDYFDLTVEQYSGEYLIDAYSFKLQDSKIPDGTLYFSDVTNNFTTIKEVKGFKFNELINDTYGFDINDLYFDKECKQPFKLNTMRITAYDFSIFVKTEPIKTYVVAFNPNNDTIGDSDVVKANTLIKKPANPTKSGYVFVNWYKDSKLTQVWNFATDTVTANTTLYAGWAKAVTVTFNSKNGSTVKPITVAVNSTFTKPADPTRSGYKFAGWYKDYNCKQPWNFATDKVTMNTLLYAGWVKSTTTTPTTPTVPTITAVATTAKVNINSKPVEFEAYNINGNNYFKLRDLALALNGTNKNFEVTWDASKKAINLISNSKYTVVGGELVKGDGKNKTAVVSTHTIYKDGVKITLTAYTINGNNYFKLRDLGQAFNFGVEWDGVNKIIDIDTTIDYAP